MERLTNNKLISDMNMLELAYNSCYADEKCNARYRNYELDIDSRELVRKLIKDMCKEDLSDMSDEEFDEYMAEMLSVEMDSQIGLLALFYRNLWAMADLREKLKEYEDLEEQGRLLKLPCKAGDTVWQIMLIGVESEHKKAIYDVFETTIIRLSIDSRMNLILSTMTKEKRGYKIEITSRTIGDMVFLTKEEAEVKLKELRGGEDE